MNPRRFISCILVMILLFGVCCACGQNQTGRKPGRMESQGFDTPGPPRLLSKNPTPLY